ncbi:MAG: hypothetical protein J6A05_06605, partial [Oscillospiraceae bacterium]|nr:hypothetical protein [Oscillospiraceae bacterium]
RRSLSVWEKLSSVLERFSNGQALVSSPQTALLKTTPATSGSLTDKLIRLYGKLLGKTFLKKGYSPDPFPKTFSLKSPIGLKPYGGFYIRSFREGV